VQADAPLVEQLVGAEPAEAAAVRAKALEAAERFERADAADGAAERDEAALCAALAAPRPPQDDCESVWSRSSNLHNHPRSIADTTVRAPVALSSKTGLPRAPHALPALQEEQLGDRDDGGGAVNLGAARAKGEAAGDKRARKAAVKAARREARQSKKETKQVFAAAHSTLQRHAASNTRAELCVMHLP
jgi:hypothetical protein